MSVSANDLVGHIMEKAIDTAAQDIPPGGKWHVSQTTDQLPDFRARNAFYRAELERQIAEKRDAERKRKEKEALEEERLLRKIESDREKLRREYLDEIEKRRFIEEQTAKRQFTIAKKLSEIQQEEERKREEEAQERERRRLAEQARILDLKEAIELRRAEEERRRQLILEQIYRGGGDSRALVRYQGHQGQGGVGGSGSGSSEGDYLRRPWNMPGWNSREYVHSAFNPQDALVLEDVYFEAPLGMLADVYKKLDNEKNRIKDIMRQRIGQGEW